MIFRSIWILFLIPFVVFAFWWLLKSRESFSFRFSSTGLCDPADKSFKQRFLFLPSLLRLLILILFLIALAGPQRVLEESKITTEGIDIVLAVDSSGSMAAEDFTINNQRVNRLEAVKNVVKEFISRRSSDRIGFVAFSAQAYTVCPLTTDYLWLRTQLERVKLGMVQDGTAIGFAIATSINRLRDSDAKSKVIILLTDGINNVVSLEPLSAARAAQALGIKIYTIGAGSKGAAPYPVTDFLGRTFYQEVQIDIDEDTLKEIARITSGRYFRATDTQSLKQIYQEIDALEKTKIEEQGYREYKELFAYFLAAALVLLLLEILLTNTVLMKIP